jgi:hypothetical protein
MLFLDGGMVMRCRAMALDGQDLVVDQMVELPDPRDPIMVRRVRETLLQEAYGRTPGKAHFHDLRIRIEVAEGHA